MTRIVAGEARGRRLAVPPAGTRPTSSRAREGLFSALDAQLASWDGLRVLDLYAGSGAVGLEALSRGAAEVVLVEQAPPAAEVVRRNIATVGLPGATLVRLPVSRFLHAAAERPSAGAGFDVVFLDPPYDLGSAELHSTLVELAVGGWLARDAVLVVERATRDADWSWPAGFVAVQARSYGDATLWYGRAQPEKREEREETER